MANNKLSMALHYSKAAGSHWTASRHTLNKNTISEELQFIFSHLSKRRGEAGVIVQLHDVPITESNLLVFWQVASCPHYSTRNSLGELAQGPHSMTSQHTLLKVPYKH